MVKKLMDYNKISTFIKVAEFSSISHAARVLRRSQSAISQQIQILEDELELKLFERKNSRIFLSPDGECIYKSAKQNLNEISESVIKLKKSRKTVEGHIRLGAHHNYSVNFQVGKAVGKFCKKHPNVSFEVTDGSSESIERDLIENRLDLGFIVVFKSPEMFNRKPIVKSTHSLCAASSYLKATGPIKTCKDILDKELIDLTEDFVCLSAFLNKRSKSLVATLKHRRPNVVVPSLEIAKHVILSGYGIGMLPDFMIEGEVRRGTITNLLPSSKLFHAGLDIAFRTNRTLRLCEKLFIEQVSNLES